MATQFVTKKLLIKEDSTDRFFEGILSAEIKDRQGEITDIDELYKALPVWMERNAPMSDTHSNRIVGRGINFERVTIKSQNGESVPAIKILGKIHNNTALDDYIWNQIVSGKYKGLSFGGATKANRTPVVQSDGSLAYALKDLEIYEVAVCEDPAVSFALITDINPMAKAKETDFVPVEKAVHVEKAGEELVVKCDGTECYINATVLKADQGTPQKDEDSPKEQETLIGAKEKDIYGQHIENYPLEDEDEKKKSTPHMIDSEGRTWYLEKEEFITKPLPTQWGAMEFSACESHAKKDPKIKNPGGYCGSIQAAVDKDTKVHAGKKEYSSTDSCISGQGKKDEIRDAEAYCGSRHNDEHGMNPNSESHKGTTGTGTGVGNQCDEKASCGDKPDLSEAGIDEVEKPSGYAEYMRKCGCSITFKGQVGGGTPTGLGAYNTTVNGTGGSKDITETITDPAQLGDPDKLENKPKKPKDPIAKTETFEEKIKGMICNWCTNKIRMQKAVNKAYLDRTESEWVTDVTKYSTSPEGIAQYGADILVKDGNLVDTNGNIIFINPFIN